MNMKVKIQKDFLILTMDKTQNIFVELVNTYKMYFTNQKL